jgi:carboxypeptidase Taq
MITPPESEFQELKERLLEISDLRGAAGVLHWDQTTYMPPGGAETRARQLATLQRLAHERFTEPAVGRLLDALRSYEESRPYDSDEASLIRIARRDYEKSVRVPPAFVAEMASHLAASYEAWAQARPADNFALVQPYLEKTLELCRQMADFFPGYVHVADPLIDFMDPGMTVATLQTLFTQLRQELVPLVQAIASRPLVDDSCLHRPFPVEQQWVFARKAAERYGYDLNHGRMDVTLHPYETAFSPRDVRIALRAEENDLGELLFGVLHEAGHAMYEQGVDLSLEGTPLAQGGSAGLHESQSRLWENIVGRSRQLWSCWYPQLQASFPGQLGAVPLETFYRAINKVQPSLIRVSADEVTYNLHVIIRFDLELELLEGRLAVRDLPEAWRERYRSDLGVVPPDDRNGVLQDSHWYDDGIGGVFQGYTLGNIMGPQFFEAAQRAHPEIPAEIARGELVTLRGWLRENVYRHGRKYTPAELVERATGGPLSIEPYMRYLRSKYGEIYGL